MLSCSTKLQNVKNWVLNINEKQVSKQRNLIFLPLHFCENKEFFLANVFPHSLTFLLLKLTDAFEMVPARLNQQRVTQTCVSLSLEGASQRHPYMQCFLHI